MCTINKKDGLHFLFPSVPMDFSMLRVYVKVIMEAVHRFQVDVLLNEGWTIAKSLIEGRNPAVPLLLKLLVK